MYVMTLHGGKEGKVGHGAWHLEFLRGFAEVTGKNITNVLNNQENGSLKKVVVNGSME